jgi:hypothetical protein
VTTPDEMFAELTEHAQAVTGDLEAGAKILSHAIRQMLVGDRTQLRASGALALDTVTRLRAMLDECERMAGVVNELAPDGGAS